MDSSAGRQALSPPEHHPQSETVHRSLGMPPEILSTRPPQLDDGVLCRHAYECSNTIPFDAFPPPYVPRNASPYQQAVRSHSSPCQAPIADVVIQYSRVDNPHHPPTSATYNAGPQFTTLRPTPLPL